jgi:putative transcriptional regulator
MFFQLVASKSLPASEIQLMAKQKRRFNRIKIVLIEKEKTNIWLAETMGVSKAAVSKWCTNDNQPTVESLFKIAEVLGVEVCELLVTQKK